LFGRVDIEIELFEKKRSEEEERGAVKTSLVVEINRMRVEVQSIEIEIEILYSSYTACVYNYTFVLF